MQELEIFKNIDTIDYIKWMNIVNKEIENQSDRALVLLCAAIIDEQLEYILKTFLIEDNQIQERIFENNAPLSTFSAKNNFCFYLGLISKHEYNTINTIRKIRNKFAHEILINTFDDDDSIKGLCSSLSIPNGMYVPDVIIIKNNHIENLEDEPLKGKSIKERFILTFKYLTQYLNSRYLDIFPIKRKEYTAKTQFKILEQSFQNLLDLNAQRIELLKKHLELLNEKKLYCEKNNITFSNELQTQIDEINTEIHACETNPFSTTEGSMLKIDFKEFSNMVNTIKTELKNQESKDISN